MTYYLLLRNLNKYEMVPVETSPYDLIDRHPNDDWYVSVYFFNEEHKEKYDATLADFESNPEKYRNDKGEIKRPSGVAGFTNVTTNRLVFDFDNEADLDAARRDALEVIDRLRSHGVTESSMQICYTGSKGFSILVKTDTTFNATELKAICTGLGGDLATFDRKVYNDVRCLRLPLTKHQKTKRYKIPLSIKDLEEMPVEAILERSTDKEWLSSLSTDMLYMEECALPSSILSLHKGKDQPVATADNYSTDVSSIDWSLKPRGISNCKYALMKGFFKEGTRDHFFTVLAATLKAQYPDEKGIVYRFLKGVAENQAKRNNTDRFPDKDIYAKVEQVFKPSWIGGQYSCKNDDELRAFCDSLGVHKCERHEHESEVFSVTNVSQMFRDYAVNIDANTIKMGIGPIDENVRITAGMHVGLLGSPGSGKTSMILNILNNTSKAGVVSFFFSMDMYAPLVYQKQLQRHTGLNEKSIFKMMTEDSAVIEAAERELAEEYKNVRFCFKSGLTVEDMRNIVLQHQQDTGERVKLIAIDYAECISGPFSDPFANSRIIAHKLKDLASQDGFCVVTLVQPPKVAGDAATPLYSMRQVKGPSDWEQGFSIILGIYREGCNPNTSENDRFITVNSLKNRMGPMFRVDCAWNGLRGTIDPLSHEEQIELDQLRQSKSKNEDSTSAYPFQKKSWS